MMDKYSTINQFLVNLLYARWNLDEVWIQRNQERSIIIHQLQIIRYEMVQFLRGFSNYIFQSIIAAQWFSLVKRLTDFNDQNLLDVDR